MSTESTKAVLARHMATLDAADLDGIMADYADDAVLITGPTVLRGTDAIRAMFSKVPKGMASAMTMTAEICDGEIAYIAWNAPGIAFGTDTLVVRDGKIVAQTVATHAG
jgi:ketosteroid isomerase-like protein